MSATKERFQNPAVDDTVKLRLIMYNQNNLSDLYEIQKVEIWYLDPEGVTETNKDGRRLVETIDGSQVTAESTGTYRYDLHMEETRYVIGRYYDIWTVKTSVGAEATPIRQMFEVHPSLWYSTPIPVVYDFGFSMSPNKMRHGSKQWIMIDIIPNVPLAGDLQRYYENLAIVSDLKISMEQTCGDCIPAERDLRMVIDEEDVDVRQKRYGYYQLDTSEMDCGLYDVWFKLEFGDNIYVSDRYKFQVFD